MSGFGVTQEGYVVDGGPLAQIGPFVAPGELWQEFLGQLQLPKDDEDDGLRWFINKFYTNKLGSEKLLVFFEKLKDMYQQSYQWDDECKRAFENLSRHILGQIDIHNDEPNIEWVLGLDVVEEFKATIDKANPWALPSWYSLEEMIRDGTPGTGRRSERRQGYRRRDEASSSSSSSGPRAQGKYREYTDEQIKDGYRLIKQYSTSDGIAQLFLDIIEDVEDELLFVIKCKTESCAKTKIEGDMIQVDSEMSNFKYIVVANVLRSTLFFSQPFSIYRSNPELIDKLHEELEEFVKSLPEDILSYERSSETPYRSEWTRQNLMQEVEDFTKKLRGDTGTIQIDRRIGVLNK